MTVMSDSPGQVDFVAQGLSTFHLFLVQCWKVKFAYKRESNTGNIFELFFCKKIPLSRRVEYVMDGSMDQSVSE